MSIILLAGIFAALPLLAGLVVFAGCQSGSGSGSSSGSSNNLSLAVSDYDFVNAGSGNILWNDPASKMEIRDGSGTLVTTIQLENQHVAYEVYCAVCYPPSAPRPTPLGNCRLVTLATGHYDITCSVRWRVAGSGEARTDTAIATVDWTGDRAVSFLLNGTGTLTVQQA